MDQNKLKYLKLLAAQYPNIAETATEIVNLKAIMNLPKGTEHFITDLHGEYEQFRNIMCNGSGAVQRKIEEEFGITMGIPEKRSLAMLIYYPEIKLPQMEKKAREDGELDDWRRVTILRLTRVCKVASSKYTRSKVRKALPEGFAYIIEELMSGHPEIENQADYYNEIIDAVIETGIARELIVAFCHLIRRFIIEHLHVIGDIYDRGPYPHRIMDDLMAYHSVDIQWGNHDILWMGAAAGSPLCICNILRISARYANLAILEEAYGINLIPLMRFAMETYKNPCDEIFSVTDNDNLYDKADAGIDSKMQKAIAMIQFKLEGQIVRRHPEWDMEDRALLDKIDYEKGTILIDGCEYEMRDMDLPTVDPNDPYALTAEEKALINHLKESFLHSGRLQKHIGFLYRKGNLYKVFNGNLLYHGCVPLNEDGSFREVEIYGEKYSGKALYDVLELYARKGFYSDEPEEKEKGLDLLWYIWQGKYSPVFGKDKMTTFERYFIEDKKTHKEPKNPYYTLYENEETVDRIFREFGLEGGEPHIINGHVPVIVKKGESPIKCGGKLLVIDGGFSKAYQAQTGNAGYTLIYNSYGLVLAAHPPFETMEKAVLDEISIDSEIVMQHSLGTRKKVADTDTGTELKARVADLEALLKAYRSGLLTEK
ncbi:MAG: fructose-1,6-bisphosphatase [Lachnospiraceae bacterium]|nr:fructose-1,6-bisphosphatase [Lachnospiraceae bacterium]